MANEGVVAAWRRRIDTWQQQRWWLGFPLAVYRKYSDDEAGRHAALMTYYGFLSLIPVLLLVVVIASAVLASNPDLRADFLDTLVPPELRPTVDSAIASMPAGGLAFWVGIIGLAATGLRIVFTAHDALSHVAGIAYRQRISGVGRYVRAVTMLGVLVVGIGVAGMLLAGVGGLGTNANATRVVQALGVTLVIMGMLAIGARLLLAQRTPLRLLWPAALGGAIVITVFLTLGATLLPRLIERSGAIYGTFATIVGALAFIALVCQALMYTAETAIVHRRHLWPRSLDRETPSDADRRALTQLAREQERLLQQRVTSTFDSS